MLKKVLAIAAAVSLCGAASARTLTPDTPDEYGYVSGYYGTMMLTEDGEVIVPDGVYTGIKLLTGDDPDCELYSVMPADYTDRPELLAQIRGEEPEDEYALYGPNPRRALADAEGNLLTDYVYTDLTWDAATDTLVGKTADGICEALDPSGNVLLSGTYYEMIPAGDGWLVSEADGDTYRILKVAADGTEQLIREDAESGWMGAVWGGGYFMIDDEQIIGVDGNVVFSAEGRGSGLYAMGSDRFARVMIEEGGSYFYQLYDRDGGLLLDGKKFDSLDGLSNGGFIGAAGNVLQFYSADAELIASEEFEEPVWSCYQNNGIVCVYLQEGEELYFSAEGERLLTEVPEGMDVNLYYETCAGEAEVVVLNGTDSSALCDLNGNIIADGLPAGLYPYYREDGRGYYIDYSTRTGKLGLYDETGRQVLPCNMESIIVLASDRLWVHYNGKCALLDSDGTALYAISDYSELMD